MRNYEAMLVLQPGLEDAGVTALVTQLSDLIRRNGGEVASVGQLADKRGHVAEVDEGWGKRRLSYPIKGNREAYYAVLRLNLPPEAVAPIEGVLRINESILRYLIIRTDELDTPAQV